MRLGLRRSQAEACGTRHVSLSVCALLLAASFARADFDPQHWRLRRRIGVDTSAPISIVRVDVTIFRGSHDRLDDIRIVRDDSEIPYALETLYGSREEREFQPSISNKSVIAGEGVQATLDLGAHPRHNRLRITTSQVNFKQRVRIETSDDAQQWATARDDGFIFDFSEGNRHISVLTVEYPLSTRRFVRATIFGWTNPDWLAAAALTYYSSTNAVRDVLASVEPAVSEDGKSQASLWMADNGFTGLPHDLLQVEIGPGLFYRMVEIETSKDAKSWLYSGQGAISRTADYEQLTLSLPEQWERYVRLRVHNGDNAPLPVRRIALSAFRRQLKFPSNAAGQYWIYYGNSDSDVKRPSYDFAHIVSSQSTTAAAALGAEEINPDYRAPVPPQKPWSDRHPRALYAVLAAAVLVMGYVAVRFLMKVKASGEF